MGRSSKKLNNFDDSSFDYISLSQFFTYVFFISCVRACIKQSFMTDVLAAVVCLFVNWMCYFVFRLCSGNFFALANPFLVLFYRLE